MAVVVLMLSILLATLIALHLGGALILLGVLTGINLIDRVIRFYDKDDLPSVTAFIQMLTRI